MQNKLSLSLIIISILYFFSGAFSSIKAEDAPLIEVADEALKLELVVVGQSYPDKSIVMKLTITPEIDIPRGSVNWTYDDLLFKMTEGNKLDIVSLKAGETTIIYKTFSPDTHFKYDPNTSFDFGVKVSGTAYDKNYLSIRTLPIALNSEFEVVPLLADYNQQKAIINTIYLVLGLIAAAIVIYLITVAVKRFRTYLNSD